MPFTGLQKVTADQLNALQPVPYYAEQSGSLSLTSTITDVPGCSITLSTATAGATYVAHGVFDFDLVDANTSGCTGYLNVDGSDQSKVARFSGTVATDIGTVTQQWKGTLAAAGSHTLKLRGACAASSDAVLFAHSTITVTIYEVV